MLLNSIFPPICLITASAKSKSNPTYFSFSTNSNGGNVVSAPTRMTLSLLEFELPQPTTPVTTAAIIPTAKASLHFLPICIINHLHLLLTIRISPSKY